MPLRDIFKRQVENLLSTERDQRHPSLADDLRNEFDRATQRAMDPGREQREADERASELHEIRQATGTGQPVRLDGLAGEWEATELINYDDTSATWTLIDRDGGEYGQLGADADGSVVLDSPNDQFTARGAVGGLWRTDSEIGLRFEELQLTSDNRSVRVTCDLRAPLPPDDVGDYPIG